MKPVNRLFALLAALLLAVFPAACSFAEEGSEPAAEEIPVWQFCHGVAEGLETAVVTAWMVDCEAGLMPREITEEEAEQLLRLARFGVITGKVSDEMVTGGTYVFTFTTPEGEYLLSIELYRGMIVGADGMYSFRVESDQ